MMMICIVCGKKLTETCNCKHAEENEYRVECYTELHYYLTEPTPE